MATSARTKSSRRSASDSEHARLQSAPLLTRFQLLLLLGVGLPTIAAIVVVADRRGFFFDTFPTRLRRRVALLVWGVVLTMTTLLPAAAALRPPDPAKLSLANLFVIQAILVAFLAMWWLLAGRPPLLDFLSWRSRRPLFDVFAGLGLGCLGWTLSVVLILVVVAPILQLTGMRPHGVPPLVRWIAALPPLHRLAIVATAMTVEELYFRAFLQRRFGPLAASVLFVAAHAGYGQPLLLVGLVAITAVLAASYRATKSTIAPIFAHGTFDAIQLFIILPTAMKLLPP